MNIASIALLNIQRDSRIPKKLHNETSWNNGEKGLKKAKQWKYEPNGEFAREPVERVAPYLNKYEAVISSSMVEFAP